jgi:hypothetical protein
MVIVGLCLLFVAVLAPTQHAKARESFATSPSAQFVSAFYSDIYKIVFLNPVGSDHDAQTSALRSLLARATDADGIGRFILGRFANDKSAANPSAPIPAEGFLDFATAAVLRLSPDSDGSSRHFPELAILTMNMRADQTRLVQSELLLPGGRRLPLVWEIADRPSGLRIEDVSCLGISLRLMLRSAVAEAASEHPEEAHDLGRLLTSNHTLTQFPTP